MYPYSWPKSEKISNINCVYKTISGVYAAVGFTCFFTELFNNVTMNVLEHTSFYTLANVL